MNINLTDDLSEVVKRCVWFESPERAIQDIPRLVAYVLTYGTPEDTFILRDQLDDVALAECLDNAPPGIYDPRSWAYWNLVVGHFDTPPMPKRRLG